ncbi:MAG: hypothetical protein ACHRXM_01290 [Isosphaerales bacterium]
MPALSEAEATERLAKAVEKASADELVEIYDELFPRGPSPPSPVVGEIVSHIRHGLAPEEIVDLWNVVFPKDRNVWYDEEEKVILYNEEQLRYAE